MVLCANLEPYEDTLNGEVTITFTLRAKKLIITNDSASNNLQYKFKNSEDFATLAPTETESFTDISLTQLTLLGTNVPYRIRAIG
jgi:hypothetical protein